MKKDLTCIAVVLDRSGSMAPRRNDVVGGFNSFLREQKAQPGDAIVTLVQFDHEYEIVHDGIPLKEVPELTARTYAPRGNTALLDAVGRAINTVGAKLAATKEKDRPGRVICLIVTDGEENASHEFTKEQIKQMILHQREVYNWDFVFLGANVDAFAEASALGVAFSKGFVASVQGVRDLWQGTSHAIRSYRSGVSAHDVWGGGGSQDGESSSGKIH